MKQFNKFFLLRQNRIVFTLLLTCIGIGFFLRYANLSPFKFYPDAYQNLIVASNIKNYHSVVGYLGEYGTVYPPFVMWSRPFYPLMIYITQTFTNDSSKAAQLLSFSAGVLAIPAAFFMLKTLFKSTPIGLSGALLLAISFNHTLWSGYIMTETLGVLLLIIFLWSLFHSFTKKAVIFATYDIVSGMLFGLAVATRYEYLLLLFPVSYLLYSKSDKPFLRLFNITSTAGLVLLAFFTQLFPVSETFDLFTFQNHLLIQRAAITVALILLIFGCAYVTPYAYKKRLSLLFYTYLPVSLLVVGCVLLLQKLFPNITFLQHELTSPREFFIHDFFIGLSLLVGALYLAKEYAYRQYLVAVMMATLLLGFIYHRVNPEMERYWTHLIPFFIIPASYGLHTMIKKINGRPAVYLLLIIVCSSYQLALSYEGLRNRGDRSWYRVSYEEKSAILVKRQLTYKNNLLLITSFPEPYYFFTQNTTHSIADRYPYIFIENVHSDQNVLIIQDMGMHDIFPQFSKLLDKQMQQYRINSFWIHEPYHFSDRSEKEKYPVVLYKTTLGQLKNKIKQYHKR